MLLLHHALLPVEVWLEIFDWATFNPNISVDESTPFQPIPDSNRRDPSLQVRLSLSQVCRSWRKWTAHALYNDIKIRHGVWELQKLLAQHEQQHEQQHDPPRRFGDMVHRVVLPYDSTITGPVGDSKQTLAVEILELCPNLHTLLRPQHWLADSLTFDWEATDVSLPSLQRLEWWHHNEAERSGGINSLGAVLRSSPNIRFLFIGGVVGRNHSCPQPEPLTLQKLEMLRLHIRSGLLTRQIIMRWTMPFLTHIILDSPPIEDGLQEIWHAFGHQLQVVEFGKHVRFLMAEDLTHCIQSCPNLRKLYYYLFFTNSASLSEAHENLTTIGIHLHVNSLLYNGGDVWKLIERHFSTFCGPHLTALRKVVLYGDWRSILHHPRFAPIQDMIRTAGRTIEVST
ncbi:hypothetical protein CPC08DRAFT_641625 [Agrocybe pediades]|nr:hypothetical protein CPC08DRAFT_641625 [Agrocybe pediades]